jgi:Homeodomain-like domain
MIRFGRWIRAAEGIMAGKEIAVKKYVVRLSAEEREQLRALIRKGKGPARRLLKARILLKADVSEGGPGWSDNKIIAALDISVSMVYRVRKQLVEEGLEAVLSRKQRATPAVPRIFDGEAPGRAVRMALHAKHGSWLDLAESELGVLSAQCLDRRISDKPTLIDEIAAWQHDRNTHHTKSDWHFTTKDARVKLKHLYPSI